MYFVYIMTNRSMTLYTGVTNNLMRRVREHKTGTGSGFTAKYKLDRLVYFERFEDIHNAIEREKCIKGWLRIRKIALIVSVNPSWKDLSEQWYERHEFQPQSMGLRRFPQGRPILRVACEERAASSSNQLNHHPRPTKTAACRKPESVM
jgi:putative endonuclease